jgi:ATP-binding cassette subfamily B protein RaxB
MLKRTRFNPVLQAGFHECGLACVAMVLSSQNIPLSLQDLRRRFKFNNRGLTLRQMIEVFDQLDVLSHPTRIEMDQLGELRLPSILHWNFDHFVVLERVTGKYIEIVDPAVGRRRIRHSDVSKSFTGIALEIDGVAKPTEETGTRPLGLLDVLPGWRAISKLAVPILFLTVALNLLTFGLPYFLKYALDTAVPAGSMSILNLALLAFFVVIATHFTLALVRVVGVTGFRRRISEHISNNLFSSLIWTKSSFFESRTTGGIITQYRSVNAITAVISDQFVSRAVDALAIVIGIVLIMAYSLTIGAIILGAVAVYYSMHYLMSRELRSRLSETIQAESRENAFFVETVGSIHAIRVFGKETARAGTWRNIRNDVENGYAAYGRLRGGLSVAQDAVVSLCWLLVAYVAVRQLIAGQLTIGLVTALISWVGVVISRVRDVATGLIEIELLKTHVTKLEDILCSDKVEPQDSQLRLEASGPGFDELRVQDLWFRYGNSGDWVLEQCSLRLRPGTVTGIIGPSGAGKTTLVRLCVGLLEPSRGTIAVCDAQGRQIERGHVLPGSAIVMQNDSLFLGSIADNISFFDVEPDIDLIRECARVACIDDFIEALPMRYNSLVGQGGQGFSAGQVQRLVLARALYRRPRFLFLDEFTSNVDEALEERIISRLKGLPMTILSVAHRRGVINACDHLYELRSGRLLQCDKAEAESLSNVA